MRIPGRRRLRAPMAAALWLGVCAMAGAKPMYAIGPAPDWVTPVVEPVPQRASPPSAPGGTRWLLVDSQARIARGAPAAFRHTLVQALDTAGVNDAARVDVSFDPSYQSLTLHAVRVWRNGVGQSQLGALDARVLQREPDLDSRIYDGRETVSLLLRDVRPGDAVEVAYTITGRNPVFAGHRFGDLGLQAGVPVAHYRQRLLADAEAPLEVRPVNGAPPALETRSGPLRDLVWDRHDVAALRADEHTPSSWDGWAAVGYTDFAGWSAVVRWALALYRPPERIGPALRVERDAIAAAQATPESRVVAALRLVQEQVRYLGVEMGVNAHAPSAPDLVFARRYGDCKEKTLLLVTLLRSLGIDASPALVNTERRDAIAGDVPSPGDFDHVVTRVRLGERVYWLDSTRAPQSGDLAHLVQSHYGRALVVAPDVEALEAMAPARATDDVAEETMSLDLRRGGTADAPLQVVTVHRGADAERLRAQIAGDGIEKLQRSYLEYYARTWKGVTVAAPMTTADDARQNALTVTEHYAVPEAWDDDPPSGSAHARFAPDEVYEWLTRPARIQRVSPLGLGAPMHRLLRLEVDLPVSRGREFDRKRVDAPQFSYERIVDGAGNHLRLDYVFSSVAPAVSPDGLAAYADKVDEARRFIAWRELRPAGAGQRTFAMLLPGLALACFVWLALRRWWRRRRQALAPGAAPAQDPSGGAAPAAPIAVPGLFAASDPVGGWPEWRLRSAIGATCTWMLAAIYIVSDKGLGWLDGTRWGWLALWSGVGVLAVARTFRSERKRRAAAFLTMPSAAARRGWTLVVVAAGAAAAWFGWRGHASPGSTSLAIAGAGLALTQWRDWVQTERQARLLLTEPMMLDVTAGSPT